MRVERSKRKEGKRKLKFYNNKGEFIESMDYEQVINFIQTLEDESDEM